MRKVVINTCYGGFGLSNEAAAQYLARRGKTAYFFVDQGAYPNRVMVQTDKAHGFYIYTSPEPSEESFFSDDAIPRDDADLIAVIEEFGAEICSGSCAQLAIVEIPDDVKWHIEEYDGIEWIAEDHRTWHGGEE